MSKSIKVNTVQGIGDLFWIYQKLAPHFDAIDLNILCVSMSNIQTRAREFCGMLPKVRAVTYQQVPSAGYHRVAQGTFPLTSALERAPGPLDYAVNDPLERGINLRDIDPGFPVLEFVDMGLPATVPRADYLCAFVSGTNRSPVVWTPAQWSAAIRKACERLGMKRVVLIGASWDLEVSREVASMLDGIAETGLVGALNLAGSVDVIRRARCFLGYQSGLNIIAENYDVPQMMIYFPKLRPMLYTWCKAESARTRFHAMTFDEDFGAMLDRAGRAWAA